MDACTNALAMDGASLCPRACKSQYQSMCRSPHTKVMLLFCTLVDLVLLSLEVSGEVISGTLSSVSKLRTRIEASSCT